MIVHVIVICVFQERWKSAHRDCTVYLTPYVGFEDAFVMPVVANPKEAEAFV